MSDDLIEHAPVRARVAFVLAVATRVLPALEENGDAFNTAVKALADAWRWEEGETVSALQLYEDDDEALVLQGSLITEKEALAAIMAATSAFYYMLWHAYKLDLSLARVRRGEVPNMSEVSEEVIDQVCQYALQTTLCDEGWLNALRQQIVNDYRTNNPEDLGAAIPRQYFGLS